MIRASLFALLVACADPAGSTMMTTYDACGGMVVDVPIVDSPHVPVGSFITWTSNPPTSGPHYPVWGAYDRDYDSIKRGFWLHDAEHGGVVFSYRCDAGCPDIAAELDDLVRALPADPHCDAPVRQRALVVADPLLPDDQTVAAVAWGTYYIATCVDRDALEAFYMDNTGRGSENTCEDGGYDEGTPLY